jgi:hypothetical protein
MITSEIIDLARARGACGEALEWASAHPLATWDDLAPMDRASGGSVAGGIARTAQRWSTPTAPASGGSAACSRERTDAERRHRGQAEADRSV